METRKDNDELEVELPAHVDDPAEAEPDHDDSVLGDGEAD
jgi:hypothetical protein